MRSIVLGATICILSVLPVMIAMGLRVTEIWQVYSIGVLLAVVSPEVFLLVQAESIWGSYQKLLQQGDYSADEKRRRRRLGSLTGIYWVLVVAIYLAVSFRNDSFSTSWPIWPVAALLFVALLGTVRIVVQPRDGQ